MNVLNPTLFMLLRDRFGRVRVTKRGEVAQQLRRSTYIDPRTGKTFTNRNIRWGESYQCNCPFCGDEHMHLYVHYLYGEMLDDGKRCWQAKCFHGCLDNVTNWDKLRDVIFGNHHSITKHSLQLDTVESVETVAMVPPTDIVAMESLPRDHESWAYLYNRGFTEESVVNYRLHYAGDNSEFMCRNKIIIPFYNNFRFCGWQARKLHIDQRGPKYFTAPGFSKSTTFYNRDIAFTQPFLVVVEGVTDVWRVGPPAVALLGKAASSWQQSALRSARKPVLVLLDADAEKEAVALENSLQGIARRVHLPSGYADPGSTPVEVLQEQIRKALES